LRSECGKFLDGATAAAAYIKNAEVVFDADVL